MLTENNIRNFCIISHIDHGKSTLADRFLEITGTISKEKMRAQYLDMMDLEQEKGITIKMQPVRMTYVLNFLNSAENKIAENETTGLQSYILNLIDTPGHADFSYEVSRSLAAVEGAILLVDVTKGIQAQTLANLELAKNQNLTIIPVINKIDLISRQPNKNFGLKSNFQIETRIKELAKLLNINEKEIIKISAKYGINIEQVLKAIIEKIPGPKINKNQNFRALIFDSKYDSYKGVIAYLRVVEGEIYLKDEIYLISSKTKGLVKELGYFEPKFSPQRKLKAGEIGYIATGIKEPEKVRIGDTITSFKNNLTGNYLQRQQNSNFKINPLPGYKEPKPVVFLSVFPKNSTDFESLKKALEKLKLNDASLFFKIEQKQSLGQGFQCGFLGLLHAEIVFERLKREFNIDLVLSAPSVIYKIILKDEKEILIYSASNWPDSLEKSRQKGISFSEIKKTQELWIKLQILTPVTYLGIISKFMKTLEGKQIKIDWLSKENIKLIYEIPLKEIITKNLYDKLKSLSQGFASMNYEILEWREANLVKLDILILGKKEEMLSRIVSKNQAYQEGKKIVENLKKNLPPQLFPVPLQAAINGKIIARETIPARKKDVIAPLYGGDYTRKKKLLEKQKRGKEKLKQRGKINIPPELFFKSNIF